MRPKRGASRVRRSSNRSAQPWAPLMCVMARHLRVKDNAQIPAVVLVLQLHLCCRHGPRLGECGRGEASMSVAVWSGSRVAWERELAALKGRIGPVFGRAEARETAGAFLDGLLSEIGRAHV